MGLAGRIRKSVDDLHVHGHVRQTMLILIIIDPGHRRDIGIYPYNYPVLKLAVLIDISSVKRSSFTNLLDSNQTDDMKHHSRVIMHGLPFRNLAVRLRLRNRKTCQVLA